MFRKLKLSLSAFALLGFLSGVLVSQSSANAMTNTSAFGSNGVVMVFDQYGHEVPFPRNAIILFPWRVIEGYWLANLGEAAGVFAFKVDSSDPVHRRLKVSYLDRNSSRVLAEGYGYPGQDGTSVEVFIQGPGLNAAVVVTAYQIKVQGVVKIELVTSIETKDGSGASVAHSYIIKKIQ